MTTRSDMCLKRRVTSATRVGNIAIGGDNPIRIQSMATTDTNDTEASVAQAKSWCASPRRECARRRT